MSKRKKYLLGIGVLIIFLVIIGISYAYWMLTIKQADMNYAMSDCFNITFEGVNDIRLNNVYPMHDDELYTFYQSATPYHFTITNTCESEASGFINLETLNSEKKLDDEYIDVILYEGTKNYLDIVKGKTESSDVYSIKGEGRVYNDINIYDYSLKGNPVNTEKVLTESITAYKLYEFTLTSLESREFNLLEYMSPDTPPIEEVMNATFESKITVTMNYQKAPGKNMLRTRGCEYSNCTDTTRVFQTDYINNATSISFENTMNAPTAYVAAFDESEMQDGSIMAYVVANESDPGTYIIRFQTDGIFLMPEDSSYYFSYLEKVVSIEGLEHVNTSQVTNMSYMFSRCSGLTSLDLSPLNTANVTDMSHMFAYCTALTSLDLSHFDTSNVTNMSGMFTNCNSFNSLDLSSFDTSKVTNMSYMFYVNSYYGRSKLTSLDLSSFDTSNVKDMEGMFWGMSGLTSIDLSPLNTSKVTNMSFMFAGMSGLTSLDLKPLNTSNVKNMEGMFQECSSLTSIDLSPLNTSNVTNMEGMFYGMSSLTSLDLSPLNTSNVIYMRGMFLSCSSLTSLDLSLLNTSNVTDMSSMFASCSSLTSIDLGQLNTSKVTDMSSMFDGCSSLTSLDLSPLDTSNVTNMSYMFYGCSVFTSLDLSNFDTSHVDNMYAMFFSCGSLTSINYGTTFVRKSSSNISVMYYNCPANKPTDPSWDGAFV